MRQNALLTGTAEGAVSLVSRRNIEFSGDAQRLLQLLWWWLVRQRRRWPAVRHQPSRPVVAQQDDDQAKPGSTPASVL